MLTIQTNKLLTRKNKSKVRNEEEEMGDFISDDEEEDGEKSYEEGEEIKERKEKKQKKGEE